MSALQNKKFVFRADASNVIGAGHVMRCLTLADAFHQEGAFNHFICREHEGHLIAHIKSRGYSVTALPFCADIIPIRNNHPSWLNTSWQQDAQDTVTAISALNIEIDWLFVDHYGIDEQWHQKLQMHTRKMAVIDDLADRRFDCDVLIDQLCHRVDSDYSPIVQKRTALLLGSDYAMLRPIFHQIRELSLQKRQTLSTIKRVFISMGGTDLLNATLVSLQILEKSNIPRHIDIDILVGQQSDYLKNHHENHTFPFNIHIHPVTTPIHELMLTADIAIGAGGLTAWERCCLGLPTFLITIAQNQHDTAYGLEKHDAVVYLGDADHFNIEYAVNLFNNYISDPERLRILSANSAKIVDGLGCQRIIDKIKNYQEC